MVVYRWSKFWILPWGNVASSITLLNWTFRWWSFIICLIFRVSSCRLKAYRDFFKLFTLWLFIMSILCLKFFNYFYSWFWNADFSLLIWIIIRSLIVWACIYCVAWSVYWAFLNFYFSTLLILSIACILLSWSSSTISPIYFLFTSSS